MITFLKQITQGYRSHLSAIVFIQMAEVVFSLLFVWFSKAIIDTATGLRSGSSLSFYAVLLVLLMTLQIFLRIADVRLRNMTEVQLENNIRRQIFSRLIYARWSELSTLHSGDVLTRIIHDTDDVVRTLVSALPTVVSASLQFMGAMVLLYIFDPVLALILGVSMPLFVAFSKLYYVQMRRYTHQIKENESSITALMEESLLNQLIIRTFERQAVNLEQLEDRQNELTYQVRKRTHISMFANALVHLSFSGGYLTALLWSVYGLARNTVSFGTVMAFLQLVARIQRPLFDLMRLLPTIIAAKASSERLIHLSLFEQENIGDNHFLSGSLSLHIERISFAYGQEKAPVFKDFTLHAKPGDMIAVMGETGAGKTTLLRLLLALIQPDKGTISITNEIETVSVCENTRSNFVYVPQGNSLFSGTIRENLLIGDKNADENTLLKVLQTASASFVFSLPNGLDTVIGEGGNGLSEGQAQRIAIARSLLRPGKIILLDEATSALDLNTEKDFLQHLKTGIDDRIILFITHHSEVAKWCDRVIKI